MKKFNSECLFKLNYKKINYELLSLLEVEPENDKNSINFIS